MNKIRVTQAFN